MTTDETNIAIAELTDRLRRTTVEKRAGALNRRVRAPLEEYLHFFVTSNTLGLVAVSDYLGDQARALAIDIKPPTQQEEFTTFAWGPMMAAMLKKVLSDKGGAACLPDVVSGLNAAADRTAGFVYEAAELLETDLELALPLLLDRIASAYVVGAALAWRGLTPTAPKDVQLVRAAIRHLDTRDSGLLHDRHAKGRETHELTQTYQLERTEVIPALTAALEQLRLADRRLSS